MTPFDANDEVKSTPVRHPGGLSKTSHRLVATDDGRGQSLSRSERRL